ncbi:hypothetical protein B9Z19DRAFT_1096766 [Tuber borchii]|uniref:Helicase C-terminal domain-containing protein n=1 Tax=Tuber borchii TaxID=42251 RepID=A0A2T6ZB40_TUBBO|nr:hypothetical protein B9Z19DRAFT_1096766 [Tuber borchii]
MTIFKLPTTSIHGDCTQREPVSYRECFFMVSDVVIFAAWRPFALENPLTIATVIAARGPDIENAIHVINYGLVQNIVEYIHRIGRTDPIGNRGLATSFFNSSNEDIATDLVKIKKIKKVFQSLLRRFPNS